MHAAPFLSATIEMMLFTLPLPRMRAPLCNKVPIEIRIAVIVAIVFCNSAKDLGIVS